MLQESCVPCQYSTSHGMTSAKWLEGTSLCALQECHMHNLCHASTAGPGQASWAHGISWAAVAGHSLRKQASEYGQKAGSV